MIFVLLQLPFIRQWGAQKMKGAAGQRRVPAEFIAGLRVPVPKQTLLEKFATIVQSIEQQKSRLRAHLTELDTLFASLQSRAFNGEL